MGKALLSPAREKADLVTLRESSPKESVQRRKVKKYSIYIV